MRYYLPIYNKLCASKVKRKDKCGEIYHNHHIIPKHMGGGDEVANIVRLTIREHIIAHFLLWKIHNTVNDLRAMKMLGARLTTAQRRTIGIWCRDNKIGWHKDGHASIAGSLGAKLQIKNKIGIHTDNQELRSEWAALGGSAGAKSQMRNKIGIHTDNQDLRREWSSKGGKAMQGLLCIHIPNQRGFTRCSEDELEQKISEGYLLGKGSYDMWTEAPKRKWGRRVSIEGVIYESPNIAGEILNTNPNNIRYKCRSTNVSYFYVEDES